MASSPYDIPELLKQISINGDKLGKDGGDARRQCLLAARSLAFALETPSEAILRNTWSEQAHHGALRTCLNLKVFEHLDERNGIAKTSAELAASTGADHVLLEHLLKHLAAMGTIYESGPNEYLPTPVSHALTIPMHKAAYPCIHDYCGPSFLAMPEFFSKNEYKYPSNPLDTPFTQSTSENGFFEYITQSSERLTVFQQHLAAKSLAWPKYLDDATFVQENLIKGAKTDGDAVFLVDVGGGAGHDLQELAQKHSDLPGKLVLQDLEGPIGEAKASKLSEKIELQEHDFFSEQPVKGARAYYFKSVLHDWPDDKSLEILKHLKDALEPGYSKLLINERVIPPTGAHWLSTGLDITMMALFGAKERTEEDWRQLLGLAGLKIVKIWTWEPAAESLIEAEQA